jgi:choline/ethanolamine kinase
LYFVDHIFQILIACNYLAGEEPDAEEVENLLQSIDKYTLASHLVWGLWGIISVSSWVRTSFCHCKTKTSVWFSNFYLVQDHVNDIDFDYKEYARQRFEQYWQKKPANLQS